MDELKELCWVYNSFTAGNYPILGVDEATKTADALQRQNNIHAKAVRRTTAVIVSQHGTPIYYTLPEKY